MASAVYKVSSSSKPPAGNARGLVEVQPRVKIHSVNEIDVKAQTFEMDLQVELQWKDLGWLEKMATPEWEEAATEHGWQEQMRKTCWHPGLVLKNRKEMRDDAEVWFRVDTEEEVQDPQDRRIYFVARVHAVFRARYKLNDFPFDMQWLTVRLASSFEFVRFVRQGVAIEDKPDFFDRAAFINEEYRPADYVCVQARPADMAASSSGKIYRELNIKVAVTRDSWYYLTNVFLIDLCLVCSSFTVLLVPPSEFQDRMGLSLTLLLTAVAFKELVNTYLPPISYSTILDKYVLCGFVMQVLVVAENAVAKVEAGEDGFWAFSDNVGFVLLFAYLVVYHLYFLREALRAMREDADYWVRKAGKISFEGQDEKEAYRWHRVQELPKQSRDARGRKSREADSGGDVVSSEPRPIGRSPRMFRPRKAQAQPYLSLEDQDEGGRA